MCIVSKAIIIGREAFSYCKGLTEVTLPHEDSYLYGAVFQGCESLTTLTLPFVGAGKGEGVYMARLGYLFGSYEIDGTDLNAYVPDTLKTVVITSGTVIGEMTFLNCDSITSIALPDSITRIKTGAFWGCTPLAEIHVSSTAAWYKIVVSPDGNPMAYGARLYVNGLPVTD